MKRKEEELEEHQNSLVNPRMSTENTGYITNLKNISRISTSPSQMRTSQYNFESKNSLSKKEKGKLKRKGTKKVKREKRKSVVQELKAKEIEIFNINEEKDNSEVAKEYREFNSPTPDLSHSKLDTGIEDFEAKTQDARVDIINIDIDVK